MANEANSASEGPKGPALPNAIPAGLSEDSKNVFTELFGKESAQKAPGLMNTVAQEVENKKISHFGKPKAEELSLKKLSAHKANPGATLLKASLLIFFITAGIFVSQTSSQFSLFGVNPALQTEIKQAQVDTLTSEVRVQKYLTAVLLLDQFSSKVDEYLYYLAQADSPYTSQNKREGFTALATELQPEIVGILSQVQSYLNEPIPGEEATLAVATADRLISQLQTEAGTGKGLTLIQEVQDLQTTKALLQDSDFHQTLSGADLDSLDFETLQTLQTQFNRISASLSASIGLIQAERRNWSFYIESIETLTKKVDPLFGTEFLGSLKINTLNFNEDGSISLIVETVTSDTKNFTLISNLIDTYENSDAFSNVSERTFVKSGAGDQTHTGTFNIVMTLESNLDSNE
jgi:hypothetical protein